MIVMIVVVIESHVQLRVCYFCSYNVVENEVQFMLECTSTTTSRDRIPSLFQNLVVGSLKSYFQLTYQFDISRYFTEATALHYYRELTFLTPS
jgi:hypothetical protein